MLRYLGFSGLSTVAVVLAVWLAMGPAASITTLVLIAIEIAFSFDNAIINAKVLERLSHFWQHLFLTVGMVIAILGMRLIFPIVIVMVTAGLSWDTVVNDALHHPEVYSQHLAAAHPAIAAFGGAFLLTLALYFLFDDAREVLWWDQLESRLQKIGGTLWLPPLVSLIIVVTVSLFAGDKAGTALQSGIIGVVSYAALQALITGLGKLEPKEQKIYTGFSAFLAFMYLQLLDASFSFDGVLGAFAITDKVILIAAGLGVGAFWVRSLTVFMVRRGTLKSYIYLEHGAHYAILVLSIALLGSIFYNVPDALTGIAGLGIILASFIASYQALKAEHAAHTR